MGFEPMNQKGRDLKPRAFDRFATRVSLNTMLVPCFFIKNCAFFNLNKSMFAVWNQNIGIL